MKIFHIGLFGTPSAGRPFADNTKGASEAARLQAAPKFSAVSATGCPLIVEPWQVRIERTLPSPEDIMAFAADHLSHQLPAVAGLAHDLLDRRSAFRQGQDSRIGLFAANVPFIPCGRLPPLPSHLQPASKRIRSALLKTSMPSWNSPRPHRGIIIGKFQFKPA
jgi:hypothetical protein